MPDPELAISGWGASRPLDKRGGGGWGGFPKTFFRRFGGSQFGLKIRGGPGPAPGSATGFIDPYDIFRPFPSQSE